MYNQNIGMFGLMCHRYKYRIFKGAVFYVSARRMSNVATNAFDVQEFAEMSFIKKSLKNPYRPESVLSFVFGVDYDDTSLEYKLQLREGQTLVNKMLKFWFAGGSEYDQLCQSFKEVVRDVGNQKLDWSTTTDGMVAQIILCDQLSRNIFRGTAEAYQYDKVALTLAASMTNRVLSGEVLNGELFPPYLGFLVLPLMHSESKEIHSETLLLLDYAQRVAPQLDTYWSIQKQMELDHKSVIDRFGRYPHRNAQKGRVSTPEELKWLADVDNLPGWAKNV
jgi:uncharacterized protein (DUF924 family)